ncbi:ABC transporter permease [Candidatus Giovannonibacteria bacterium]|nr:ABC transporter permease [Candidatus Giovannonibacteria bacterium]
MRTKFLFSTSLRGLGAHKSRSFLTILGIVIGITAIILVMSIGQGAQNLILSQIQGMGSKTIVVAPGRQPSGPSDFAQIFSDSLKKRDIDLLSLKENVPYAKHIIPVVFGGENSSYGDETYRMTVFGSDERVFDIFELFPEAGVLFSESEVKGHQPVVVIGSTVKDELFGDSEAVGERIRIKGKNFRIIGVLPKKGQVSFFNFDTMAVIPYTVAQEDIFGIKYYHRFLIEADQESHIDAAVDDIKIVLRNSHNITDPDKDDFFVETQADLASRIGTITDILTLLLVSIAAISLVVGGIGIMNIMLVAVTERTKEIGLRKSIGATNRDILRQFLLEAIVLTSVGGLVGIFLGALFSFIISVVLTKTLGLSWSYSFPVFAAVLGIAVSGIIGLVFGIYPARKASRKNPIEALRYE